MRKKAIVLASMLLVLSFTACTKSSVQEGVKPPADIVKPLPDAQNIKYLFSSTGVVDIASNWGEWSTKTHIDTSKGDAPYAKVVTLTSQAGGTWEGTVLAFPGLVDGFSKEFEKLEFKVKSSKYTEVVIKFAKGEKIGFEKTYKISSGTALTNEWTQMSIPLSDFATVTDAANEFAIFNNTEFKAGEKLLLTDIALSGKKSVVNPPVDPPVDPPIIVPPVTGEVAYFYSQTGETGIVSKWDTWGTGTTIATDATDSAYSKIIKLTGASSWGTVLAFPGLTEGLFATYTNLEFKIKSSDFTELMVKLAKGEPVGLEKKYSLSSGTDLGNGWIQMKIPLSDFSSVSSVANEFAIFNNTQHAAGKIMYLTDIALTGKKAPVVVPPVVPGTETGTVIKTTNLTRNSAFETDMNDWTVWSEGRSTQSVVGGALKIVTTDIGDAWWKTQLFQENISLVGKDAGTYRLSFDVSAEKATDMVVEFGLVGSGRTLKSGSGTPFGEAGNAAKFDITTTTTRVFQDIELFGFDGNAAINKLIFGLGKVSTKSVPTTVTIDNIRLERVIF